MKQAFIDLMHQLGRNTTEACGLFVDRDVRLAWDVYQAAQCRNRAMQAICDGMSAEDMEQAPFTYKALLEIVRRRDVRNACVPDKIGTSEWPEPYDDGWNACREAMISKMREQK